jgi:hypothetical protein
MSQSYGRTRRNRLGCYEYEMFPGALNTLKHAAMVSDTKSGLSNSCLLVKRVLSTVEKQVFSRDCSSISTLPKAEVDSQQLRRVVLTDIIFTKTSLSLQFVCGPLIGCAMANIVLLPSRDSLASPWYCRTPRPNYKYNRKLFTQIAFG